MKQGYFIFYQFVYETVEPEEASLAITDGNSKTSDKFHRKPIKE